MIQEQVLQRGLYKTAILLAIGRSGGSGGGGVGGCGDGSSSMGSELFWVGIGVFNNHLAWVTEDRYLHVCSEEGSCWGPASSQI